MEENSYYLYHMTSCISIACVFC